MALPIGATPVLKGEEATRFIAMIHEDAKTLVKPTPTPKLKKARQLIRKYAKDEQNLVR